VSGLILGASCEPTPPAGWHDLYLLVLFAIGSAVMRGAGCTFNDIVDRDIDAGGAYARQADSSGAVTIRNAWLFLGAMLVGLPPFGFNRFVILLGVSSLFLSPPTFMKRCG
jgi:4-hydroxybenzoate polyprenyltransferase